MNEPAELSPANPPMASVRPDAGHVAGGIGGGDRADVVGGRPAIAVLADQAAAEGLELKLLSLPETVVVTETSPVAYER